MIEGSKEAILVVGAGGLGCPALLGLVEGGARRIGIADPDVVEVSNLHRQLLHTPADEGRNKAEVAGERLRAACPGIVVEVFPDRVTADNAASILGGYGFVIDATDGPGSKFLLNDATAALGIPLAHGGVTGLEGQLLTILPGETACLRCLFPEEPREDEVPACREAGVLGPVAGLVGALQAEEALRYLRGEPLSFADRLLGVDARTLAFRLVPLRRSPSCPLAAPVESKENP